MGAGVSLEGQFSSSKETSWGADRDLSRIGERQEGNLRRVKECAEASRARIADVFDKAINLEVFRHLI